MIHHSEIDLTDHTAPVHVYTASDVARANGGADLINDQFSAVRTGYVRRHGWLELTGVDRDYYDNLPTTTYVVGTNHLGEVNVGCRFTSVVAPSNSLSAEMWSSGSNARLAREASMNAEHDPVFRQALESNSTWDLTRLVENFDPSVSKRDRMASVLGVLVAAARTERLATDDSVWVFTLSEPLERGLVLMGVGVKTLFRGKVSESDKTKAVLGYVKPVEALQTCRDLLLEKEAKLVGGIILEAMSKPVIETKARETAKLELIESSVI